MLSVKEIKSASAAGDYYHALDNYYHKDVKTLEEAEKETKWLGKGAEALGLAGIVKKEDHVKMLHGELPNGDKLGIMRDGKWHHRAGFDLTFSAPKSVSIAIALTKDEKLKDALKQAVWDAAQSTLQWIEKHYAECRVTEQGITRYEKNP